ncbi:methyltransferase [Pseudoduganella sp. GCM10020061]|uniref:methyltransferase n=1 Tax=Pseudoduganella sp. GCM10020061 TaxID=3317345 RepID=UPI0036302B04
MQEPWDVRQLSKLGEALREARYQFVTPTNATIRRVNGRDPHARARQAVDIFGWGRPMDGAQDAEATPWLARVIETGLARQEQGQWRTPLRAATLGAHLLFHTSGPGAARDAVFFGPDSYRFVRALRCELASRPVHCAKALDLGCGAGAGAITLAALYPRAEVVATDINGKALRLASLNAALAGAPNVITRHSDLYDDTGGGYDLIVANPPFIADPDGRAYRDGGEDDGLGVSRRIVEGALERLAPGGALMLYTGVAISGGRDPLRDHVEQHIGGRAAFHYAEIDPDIFGDLLATEAYRHADRIAAVWLVVRKPSM